MMTSKSKNGCTVTVYKGDAKTLLAFNLAEGKAKNLAGFTICYRIGAGQPYYLQNNLRFKDPSKHAQDTTQSPNSCLNAPLHKFRWVHVPGSLHQGVDPVYGTYSYSVTPRYFDDSGSLQPIDPEGTVTVPIEVGPWEDSKIEIANTRGFTQSQAFVHHFGPKARFRPAKKELLFDTSEVSGRNSAGQEYTFDQQYEWLGFTARRKIIDMLDEVVKNKKLSIEMFAYDLSDPSVLKRMFVLAAQGRIKLILDDATLHHNKKVAKPEDQVEKQFKKFAKSRKSILRGHFARYAHCKVIIVLKDGVPVKVLTGSTNFSITGLYVNSNHVVVFNDPDVAKAYSDVFKEVWDGNVSVKFKNSDEAKQPTKFQFGPKTRCEINFSPHETAYAKKLLDDMAARIAAEGQNSTGKTGSVLFAVMGIDVGSGAVLKSLREVHKKENIFSYGISDSPGGIRLYSRRDKTGVLVSGKPAKTFLPPPFDQVPGVGLGHQVHHKFVVCGFNGPAPVVYCGSSNLAQKGEESNGDNLIAFYGEDVATVFAIEALTLVDHFDFLDRSEDKSKKSAAKIKSASKQHQAVDAGWFLSTSGKWAEPYYDDKDLRYVDRELFA